MSPYELMLMAGKKSPQVEGIESLLSQMQPDPNSTPWLNPQVVEQYRERSGASMPNATQPDPNGMDPMDIWKRLQNDPDAKKWRAEIEKEMQSQRVGIKNQQDLADLYAKTPAQLDLSPLAALSDSITPGGKLLAGYKRPETPEERIAGVAALNKNPQDERQKLISNLATLAKGSSDNKLLGMMYGKESTQQLSAQKQAAAVDKDLTQRADGFARMQDLYKNATDKSLPLEKRVAANEGFRSMLTQEQLRLEVGARTASSVAEQREAKYASQKAKEWLQTFSNKPLDTLPEGELRNSGNILKVMGKSYLDQGNRQYDQLLSRSLPSQEKIFQNSKKQFNESYTPILNPNDQAITGGGGFQKPAHVPQAAWDMATPKQQQDLINSLK